MTNASKDSLLVLIKSLSKSEKRQFKLYVNRLGVNADAKFWHFLILWIRWMTIMKTSF